LLKIAEDCCTFVWVRLGSIRVAGWSDRRRGDAPARPGGQLPLERQATRLGLGSFCQIRDALQKTEGYCTLLQVFEGAEAGAWL
jgi:hypothetical protein